MATGLFSRGFLKIFDDDTDGSITVGRNAAGNLLIDGGAVPVAGGVPTIANTTLLQLFGRGGNDTLTIDETNDVLPHANMFGGAGNDTITSGSGSDMLFGQSGNDTLLGKGGDDLLFGGTGNDTMTGGAGSDQMFGQSGNDRMIWNPGDGSDLMEGGAEFDTAEINGGNGAETFAITANGARVRFDRVTPAPFSLDIGTTEALVLNANGGDDFITATGDFAVLIGLTIDGGAGNDTITASNRADLILGGDGDDTVSGAGGDDTALLGANDDTFIWNPGDGSDIIEGQAGIDSLLFNGANIGETIDISANGGRTRFTRDVATVTMDMNDVEKIDFQALGGADNITINDLSGTDVTDVSINLAASGTIGDSVSDTIVINATDGADVIQVFGDNGGVSVLGLAAQIHITGFDASDRLIINGLGGDDVVEASGLAALLFLTANGGVGADVLIGSSGNDILNGGDGDDILVGGGGASDIFDGGAGDNVIIR